jgi:hypothetical protein
VEGTDGATSAADGGAGAGAGAGGGGGVTHRAQDSPMCPHSETATKEVNRSAERQTRRPQRTAEYAHPRVCRPTAALRQHRLPRLSLQR